MNIAHPLIGLLALFLASPCAYAAKVSPTNSVTAEFDVTGVTPAAITRFGYACRSTCDVNASGDPKNLRGGAHILVKFGTTAGADDLGSFVFPIPHEVDLNNVNTSFGVSSFEPIGESVTSVFMTFAYVDDEFYVDRMLLFIGGKILRSEPH